MYPPGGFPAPVGSFQQPVKPPGVDPTSGELVYVGINCAWLPYIAGALTQLLLQSTWRVETTEEFVIVQGQAIKLMNLFNCRILPTLQDLIGIIGTEGDDCMGCCLRFQDGKLQQLVCGVWEDVPGQGSGTPVTPTQPGAGSPQPAPGGGQSQYCGALSRDDQWLLPTPVNAGDVLLFNNLAGAWNDDREIIWNCPDGWVYALGACGQTFPHGSPDPLPTALHMSLIALIDGNYYNVLNLDTEGNPQHFIIPGGISNAQCLIIANIDDASHVKGEVSFCVNIENNQAGNAPWQSVIDMTLFPYIGVIDAIDGSYVATVGYDGVPVGDSPSYVQLYIATGAFEMDSVVMTYNQGTLGSDPGFQIQADGSALNSGTQGVGDGLTEGAGAHSVTTNLQFILTTGAGGGTSTIAKIVINGHGAKPTVLP